MRLNNIYSNKTVVNVNDLVSVCKDVDRNEWVMAAIDLVTKGDHVFLANDRPSICYENLLSDISQRDGFEDALSLAIKKGNIELLWNHLESEAQKQLGQLADDYEIGR